MASKELLHDLLSPLVKEWGRDAIKDVLSREDWPNSRLRRSGKHSERNGENPFEKILAIQLSKARVSNEQESALLQISERYARKEFLPSVADVREFLILMGERPAGMKDRREAFRSLLSALVTLPEHTLKNLLQSALHSGPAELGPLSDAIAAAGASRHVRKVQTETAHHETDSLGRAS